MEVDTNPSERPRKKSRSDLTIEAHVKGLTRMKQEPRQSEDTKEKVRQELRGRGCIVPDNW